MPTSIRVELRERSYDIEIGRGNLASAGPFLADRLAARHAVVITDSKVQSPHAQRVQASLVAAGLRCDLLVVPSGEASKSVEQAAELWNKLVALKADRSSAIVAVGGGVIGDLAGFIAATFGRGLSFIQIPTTLLAHVDSSVGGKVGINLTTAKNIVGAFWQPAGVLIDLDTLATLPDREYRSGLAEVVKYGVILDADFFRYLEEHVPQINARQADVLEHIVARCCRLKADVVEQDEREETGLRAVLNYGHTLCHAIETVSGYGTYLHGEAVAMGMIGESRLAELLGRIDAEITQRQDTLLKTLGLTTHVAGLDADALIAAMYHDKKTHQGKLRFVLPTRLGHVELVTVVGEERVRQALA